MKKLKRRGFYRSFDHSDPPHIAKYGTTAYFRDIKFQDNSFYKKEVIGNRTIYHPFPKGTTLKEMLGE